MKRLWGRITGKDKHFKFPDQQITHQGRIGNFTVIFPYGMHCDLPSDVLVKQVESDAVIPVTVARIGGLDQGDVVLFHPGKKSYIVFKNNGDIEILTLPGGEAEIRIKTKKLTIDGDLTVTGDTKLADSVTSSGVDISNSHIHPENDNGGPTDPPI